MVKDVIVYLHDWSWGHNYKCHGPCTQENSVWWRRQLIWDEKRHTNGQEAHEKMLNRNVNQNYNEVLPHISQNGHHQKPSVQVSSVQSLSHVWLFATPWIAARQASLSITNSWSSLKFTSIESVMPSSHLILCHPLLLLSPIPPSIRVFSNESTLRMRWPKYWSFSFSISPSKELLGLISFRMDWLDLLAVQGTLKSLLQHHTSKSSILQRSAFFIVQLSHPYMTTGKTIALTDLCWQSKDRKP